MSSGSLQIWLTRCYQGLTEQVGSSLGRIRTKTDAWAAHRLKVLASLGMPEDYVVTFPVAGFDPKKK
jgi:hypothetical protein